MLNTSDLANILGDLLPIGYRDLLNSSDITSLTHMFHLLDSKTEAESYNTKTDSSPGESYTTVDCSLVKRPMIDEKTLNSSTNGHGPSEILGSQKVQVYQIHGRIRQFVSRLDKTYRICELMTKILRGESTHSIDYELSSMESTLLNGLLFRKYNNSTISDSAVISPIFNDYLGFIDGAKLRFSHDFTDMINSTKIFTDFLQSLNISKRIEENNKFVYKHTTSYLITQFVFHHDLKFNSATENLYYQNYFSAYANKWNMDITDFCDPLKTTLKGVKKVKSLNTDYLVRILKCDKYRVDFFRYLRNGFEDDYLSATHKKLERLLFVLEERLQSTPTDDHEKILHDFIRTKINHRWCKIPWSRSEVRSAINHFIGYFTELLSRNSIYKSDTTGDKFKTSIDLNIQDEISKEVVSPVLELPNSKKNKDYLRIQHVGIILNYKKVRKHSLSLFSASDISMMCKVVRGNII